MLDDLTTPLDLEGAVLGPVIVPVTSERVAFYAEVTGDDPQRWATEAPPGFGSVLLFAVADLFLYHPKVVPYTATLLHLDQTFEYVGAMRTDTDVTVEGSITRVRERAGSFFVTFVAVGSDESGEVIRSTSTFVLSDQAAPVPESVNVEPEARFRGENHGALRSASRHDLVRYAAATRDFNPLHWDHEVAVAAGLPGTVAHGLLMYAWMAQEVTSESGRSLSSMKVRFRSALHPGQQATVVTTVDGDTASIRLLVADVDLVTGTASLG
jgi:acyl dehydratase